MFSVDKNLLKSRNKIPLDDENSDNFLDSITSETMATIQGLTGSILEDYAVSEVFPLDKNLLYRNLPSKRFPLRLRSGFVTDVKVSIYKSVDNQLVPFAYEIDYEAGMIYIKEDAYSEGIDEVQVSYKTGSYDYPSWLTELFLSLVKYQSSLPNEGEDNSTTLKTNINTILKNNRRPIGNCIQSIFVNSAKL